MTIPIVSQLDAQRQRLGWTYAEIAARAGTSPAAVHRCLSGKQQPRADLIERLATAMCCEVLVRPK
jgi:transcriptional regulator with XRE-family HTH domain